MKTIKYSCVVILASLILAGCSKDLNLVPKSAVAQNSLGVSDIAQLRTGMYSTMEDVIFNGWFDFDKHSENLKGGPGFSLVDPVSMTPADADITAIWQNAYKGISNINFLIGAIDNLGSAANKTTLSYKGEALYFRALMYYNLVTRWGGVPVLTTVSTDRIPRATEAQVWTQIKNDLLTARPLVSAYSSNVYVSDQAVKALMARIYLATGDKPNAALYADSVINLSGGKFALSTDASSYSTMFTSGAASKEIIFALANNSSANTHVFYAYINDIDATWNYSPATIPYQNLYSDGALPVTKRGDKRKTAAFTADATRLIKFPNGKAGQQLAAIANSSATPIIISRLAEMYLIKAEALGAANGAPTLNTYLVARYDTPPTQASLSALSASQYNDAILDENRREFFGEGHWWFDIKRTGRTDLLTSLAGRTYLLYYPVPQVEKDLAGYTQNPGYGQ